MKHSQTSAQPIMLCQSEIFVARIEVLLETEWRSTMRPVPAECSSVKMFGEDAVMIPEMNKKKNAGREETMSYECHAPTRCQLPGEVSTPCILFMHFSIISLYISVYLAVNKHHIQVHPASLSTHARCSCARLCRYIMVKEN